MKDNEKTVLLGGVTYDETDTPYHLEADYDYDYDYEDEKYLQRASILFDYPYEKEENTFIGLGEIPNENITINYNYPNKPIESNVRDLRKEQDIIASQAKANRVYVPEKQNNQRIDYINKPLMNNGLTYIPEKNEIEMKPKKPIKQEKNYEEIANWFYPNMPEKSQIQESSRIPLLSENNQPPVKYYDDYPTLADRDYVVKPVQESFTGAAAKIPELSSKKDSVNNPYLNKTKEENKNADKIVNSEINNFKNIMSNKIDNTVFSDNARKKARSFIQKAEKFEEKAYQDEKGIWTIGYGHTKDVKPGDKITQEEAEKLYAEDFKIHSEPLKYVKVPLNDNEKVALASLIFNIGESQFKNSTVLRKLNAGDRKAAAEAFKLFCKESKTKIIDGKPVKKLEFSKGLYSRRVQEMKLFLTPDDK